MSRNASSPILIKTIRTWFPLGTIRYGASAILPAAAMAIFLSASPLSAQNSATTVSVNATANQHAINPNIYGLGGGPTTAQIAALNAPLNRMGGDNNSDYNWQLDATNLDSDWYFTDYLQDGPPVVPGASYDITIQNTRNANVDSEPMVTIPMLPYIANSLSNANTDTPSLWSYSIAKYGPQVACGGLAANDPYESDAGSGCLAGGGYVVNDPTDAYVPNSVAIEKALVEHLVAKWGLSTTTTGVKYYVLDNEPSLWSSVHRDAHPKLETYEEEYNNIVAYASAIRSVDPNAKIVGPEEWIWWAMWNSGLDQTNGSGAPGSDYSTHGNTYYYPWLLQQLYAYQQKTGIKMLDVLSVHCYTDADSSTYNVTTRELWDPNYVDPNWEGPSGINLNGGVLDWIPLMKQWVAQYYPGLEIGCTEYDWGSNNSLSGATAEADALGIYGVYGFDLATSWGVPPQPGFLAMQMYRNYDGKLSTFGDTSVSTTVVNPDNLSAFAAVRSSDKALTVMVINKHTGTTPVTVNLANFTGAASATAYQVSSATQTSITKLGSVAVTGNAITFTAPSQSVTLFVVPPAATPTAATPTFSSPTGTYTAPLNISLADTTSGAAIYYTTNGATPTSGSTKYATAIPVSATETIKAIAVASGYNNSAVASATYTIANIGAMSSPAPGSTLAGSSVTFTWTAGSGVTQYLLHVGTTGAGSNNIASTSALTTLSDTISGIPTTGGTLYVRLYSWVSSAWQYVDYTYTEATASKTAMSSPTPGGTLSGSSTTFTWTAGSGATQYLLHVGSSGVGSNNIASTSALTTLSDTISGIPTSGGTLYVRLYSWVGGAWQYSDYTYTEATASKTAMSSPAPGSTLSGPSVTFTWTAGSGATQYLLHVGTTGVGSNNIASTGSVTTLSDTISGIPTIGGTLYVRLYSWVGGAWQYSDYTYTEAR